MRKIEIGNNRRLAFIFLGGWVREGGTEGEGGRSTFCQTCPSLSKIWSKRPLWYQKMPDAAEPTSEIGLIKKTSLTPTPSTTHLCQCFRITHRFVLFQTEIYRSSLKFIEAAFGVNLPSPTNWDWGKRGMSMNSTPDLTSWREEIVFANVF